MIYCKNHCRISIPFVVTAIAVLFVSVIYAGPSYADSVKWTLTNVTLADGGTVTITQSSVSFEQVLGKFIFSVSDLSANVQKSLDQKKATP